ncbi:dnc [Symbiodinium sp. CCMP2456]|nr:dnc [Symbiodinium sp. CCMP2456]
MDHIQTFGDSGVTFIYEHPGGSDDVATEAHAIVVMKRGHGFMAAIPEDVITPGELAAGAHASMEDVIGPSYRANVAGGLLGDEGITAQPGVTVRCVIVDFSALAVPRFTPLERVAFYSAEEGPAVPPARARLRLSKDDPPRAVGGATGSEQPPRPKRVTTSALATQLEALTASLPSIAAKLEDVVSKQEAMEKKMSAGPTAPLLAAAAEAEELEGETGQEDSSHLARAVLAQSQALTALVAQLSSANSDPLLDLSSQGAASTRGAAQRNRLQDELASGRGTFYSAVLANMARRMAPAVTHTVDPATLLSQGICLTRYHERFGGFGQVKDLALIAHQVAMAMDAMQAGKIEQCQDHLALLAVSLEQASLDGGRMDLAYQLTWLEEPPAGMFANRSVTTLGRNRPFAPLASQRWMTVVLGYLREMEVIQNRRGRQAKAAAKTAEEGPPGATCLKFQGQPEAPSAAHVSSSFCTTSTFAKFAASLPRWVLRSRTGFGAYLASTFASPSDRSGSAPPSATFPLPLPYLGLFQGSGPRLSRVAWRRLYQRRLLCVSVLALNYIHDGFRRPSQELLWRLPNAHQRQVYNRLMKLIRACDRPGEEYPLPPGRSGFEFVARLLELESFSAAAGLGDRSNFGYSALAGSQVPQVSPSPDLPQLHPYRSLDVSRMKLSGKGHWDLAAWLDGPLWLPFQDPSILHHGLGFDPAAVPSFESEDREENLRLSVLWSRNGLLDLVPGPPPYLGRCRVFGAFKAVDRDRQIGDRRLPNASEMHVRGPSALLPSGSSLLAMELPRHTHRIVAFISDRKDFYHQARVSRARSVTNCLPFDFWGWELRAAGIREGSSSACVPVLVDWDCYTPCFKSLFQGDHLGVEFALEAHSQLLSYHGALRPEQALLNREPPPIGHDAQALVIDDFVSVSILPRSADPLRSPAAHAIEGSPEKDVIAADCFQEDCSCVFESQSSLSPYHFLYLGFAALRGVGCRVDVSAKATQRAFAQPRRMAQELVLASVLSAFVSSDLSAPTLPAVFATDASLGSGATCSAPVEKSFAQSLWKTADRRGGYSRLDVGARELLRAAGEALEDEDVGPSFESPPKQVPFKIDVLLIGRCSKSLVKRAPNFGLRPGMSLVSWCFPFPPGRALRQRLLLEGSLRPLTLTCASTAGTPAAVLWDLLQIFRQKGTEDPLPPGLSDEVLRSFEVALSSSDRGLEQPGLESIVANDVLMTAAWKVDRVVPWRGQSHINTLELGTIGILERDLAIHSPSCRFTVLVDSNVAKSCSAKGRSTSYALQPGLSYGTPGSALSESLVGRPLASWARLFLVLVAERVGFSEALLHTLAGRFASELGRSPDHSVLDFDGTLGFPGEGPPLEDRCFSERLQYLCYGFATLLAPTALLFTASWTFCFHLVFSPLAFGLSWTKLKSFVCSLRVELFFSLVPSCDTLPAWLYLDFDPTLGFPGEGWVFWFRVFGVLVAAAMAAPAPGTPADADRATRRAGLLLEADRVVRPVTRSNRARLAEAFSQWLLESQGRSLESLLAVSWEHVEQIGEALTAYGQHLFRSGQAYYKFSETINAVASLRPAIRRSLTRPWDLAFAWLTEEPTNHHKAMPKSILLAVMAVALLWGWPVEAAIFGLAWTGLLRIGEVLNATRRDLVLPDDAAPGTNHALLRISTPKTRGRAARHQAARVDPSDIVELLSVVFGPLPAAAKLWPYSDGVLRRRLRTILDRLGLVNGEKPAFDLASFRPGGATWMLAQTENAELVRRRGRWLSGRVMEIYLQEITAATFVPQLPPQAREVIGDLAAAFSGVLSRALFFEKSLLPRRIWYHLFSGRPTARAWER